MRISNSSAIKRNSNFDCVRCIEFRICLFQIRIKNVWLDRSQMAFPYEHKCLCVRRKLNVFIVDMKSKKCEEIVIG